MDVRIGDTTLRLLAGRGVYWPAHECLFVADTHFGKEATFRHGGIPVPRGSTHGTADRITRMIESTAATRLVILGDMFHTRSSLSDDVCEALDCFFRRNSGIEITLVEGNHDIHVGRLPERWPVDVVAPGTTIDGVSMTHHPGDLAAGVNLQLCGHVHPVLRLGNAADSLGPLPCFWLSRGNLILPAVGKFTGSHSVRLRADDQAWMIIEDQVVARHQPASSV